MNLVEIENSIWSAGDCFGLFVSVKVTHCLTIVTLEFRISRIVFIFSEHVAKYVAHAIWMKFG
jgi:hypothetical protein